MAKPSTPSSKGDDSPRDHTDDGDYLISVVIAQDASAYLKSDSGMALGAGRWSADLYYRTSTGRTVYILGDSSNRRWRKIPCIPDDELKNEAARQKAHDRMVPVMESYREYRRRTEKRYEVLREEAVREKLPLVPVLPTQDGR